MRTYKIIDELRDVYASGITSEEEADKLSRKLERKAAERGEWCPYMVVVENWN